MSDDQFKRALRNSGILAALVGAIALYQQETFIVASMSFIFSWAVMFAAMYLSNKFTQKLTSKNESKDIK